MSGHREGAAAMNPEHEGRRVADGAGGGVQPLALFCALTGLLALILSVGYAVAPSLSRPPGYVPLSGGTPGATAEARAGGAAPGCTGAGCASEGDDPGLASPSGSGGGSGAPLPTVVSRPSQTPRRSVAGTASVAGSIPATAAPVRVLLTITGGAQPVSVPAALADSPLLPLVVEAYLRCWDGRAAAYAAGDPAALATVLAEPALGEATGRIARLRAEGRVQRFEGGHALTVVAIEGDRAWLVDEYVLRQRDEPQPQPTVGPSSTMPMHAPSSRPEVVERYRVSFILLRVDGVWKIADSVSNVVR